MSEKEKVLTKILSMVAEERTKDWIVIQNINNYIKKELIIQDETNNITS